MFVELESVTFQLATVSLPTSALPEQSVSMGCASARLGWSSRASASACLSLMVRLSFRSRRFPDAFGGFYSFQ